MASAKPTPKKWVLITARLITAAVSLAGAEAMLWFGGYPNWWAMDPTWGGGSPEYQADIDLGWEPRKGQFDLVWADGSDDRHPFHYANWGEGRRATSPLEPVRGERPKVFFFGDSYIQGYGLSDAETLPWVVQQRHPELEVDNYGAGSYGTLQSYLAMKKRVHEPASVYYLFNAFHEDRNVGAPSYLRIMKHAPPGWSYPYATLDGDDVAIGRSQGEVVWPLARDLRTVAMIQDYSLIAKSYSRVHDKRRITEILLAKMNQTVSTAGAKLTIILFDMDEKERAAYRDFLQSQHISFVDCDTPERKDAGLRLPDHQHPTAKLNTLLAEWIEPVITAPEPHGSPNRSEHKKLAAVGALR